MNTLIQIDEAFKNFAEHHQQINTYFNQNTAEFQTFTNLYAAMVSVVQEARIEQGQQTISFNVFFIDLEKNDKSNRMDVLSDQLQIANDFIAYFKEYADADWYISLDNVTLTPVEEPLIDDIVTGWMMNVDVIIPDALSQCVIPLK